jgi:hypothetical protein
LTALAEGPVGTPRKKAEPARRPVAKKMLTSCQSRNLGGLREARNLALLPPRNGLGRLSRAGPGRDEPPGGGSSRARARREEDERGPPPAGATAGFFAPPICLPGASPAGRPASGCRARKPARRRGPTAARARPQSPGLAVPGGPAVPRRDGRQRSGARGAAPSASPRLAAALQPSPWFSCDGSPPAWAPTCSPPVAL